MRLRSASHLKRIGVALSPEEIAVLQMIERADGPQRVGTLAQMLLRDATTVKRQIDSLVKQKLVFRQTDPDDRRGIIISASEKGKELVAETRDGMATIWADALAGVPKRDIDTLNATLIQILENLTSVT